VGSILLDSNKNNSNHDQDRCMNSHLYGRIIIENNGQFTEKLVFLRCKSWKCPFCSKINSKVFRIKFRNGLNLLYDELSRIKGFRPNYWFKFLTLTAPGGEYRKKSNSEIESDLKKNFNRLRTALKKDIGDFQYIWVVEPHKSGVPHLHVLIMGKNIANKSVMSKIEALWRERYGMGYIWLQSIKNGLKGIVWYMSKYMAKGMESGLKGGRVYSASRGFKSLMSQDDKERRLNYTVIEFGSYCMMDDGFQFRPMYEITCDGDIQSMINECDFLEFSRQVDEVIMIQKNKQLLLW